MGGGFDAAISFGVTDSVVVNASIICIESVSVLASIVRIESLTVLASTVATFGRARLLWFGTRAGRTSAVRAGRLKSGSSVLFCSKAATFSSAARHSLVAALACC